MDDRHAAVHVHDPNNGDELYEYDPVNRLTSVLDAEHHPLLVKTYG
jgi:YD repeat-containing protein